MTSHRFGALMANFTTGGAGPDLVLLHAGGSSGAQWRKAAGFLENDYRLLMPDLIGYGATDPWPGPEPFSHDDQAALVASIIAAQCAGPVHLVGHSFGGAVAVRLALAHGELLDRLILIEPVLTPLLKLDGRQDVFAEYYRLARGFIDNGSSGREAEAWRDFIDYRNGAGTWDGLSDKARARFLAGTQSTVDTYIANLANPTTLEDLRTIAAPTLVLCGQNTTEPDRQVTEIVHRELPNSAYLVIPGAEHMSPLTHPEEVSAAVIGHLKKNLSG